MKSVNRYLLIIFELSAPLSRVEARGAENLLHANVNLMNGFLSDFLSV